VINNGRDIDIFIPHKNIERRKFRMITTASADVPLKGLDYSLMALSSLKDKYPYIELIVIGKIKKDGHTSKLIKGLGIKDSIKFKTDLSKEEIAKEYAKSSISIVSSLYEGFGYPVIEAMSCAVPLVAANTSSIPELVGDYATLIPAKSSKELAESIKDIFSDYLKYKNIAEAGRQHIIDNFNWLKITQEYENIIYKTIEEHKNADL
jgi:glycosyltransferase involved in cell wall biosynthesis